MSGVSLRCLSASECEFLAENELVMINPTFKQRQYDFIQVNPNPVIDINGIFTVYFMLDCSPKDFFKIYACST
jgi:hypothetical protein